MFRAEISPGNIFTIIFFAMAIYLIIISLSYFLQSKFIYYPVKRIERSPEYLGFDYQEICYLTKDKIAISAWYIPVSNSKLTVLFCHGNAGNISHRLDSIKIFNQLGLNTFIFDYRGYGKSQGRPTEKGTYLDAEGALTYLTEKKKLSPDKLIIFGRSLGASVAAWLAQKYAIKSIIIESTFTSIADLGAELYPILPVKLLCRFKYHTREYVKNIHSPLLIIHSLDDEIIPFHHSQHILKAANLPKKLLQLNGSHNEAFLLSSKKYFEGLKEFIFQ